MQAVILAAGDGGRLRPHSSGVPKPLVELGGRPIINHVLDALESAGVDDATLVVGHGGDAIRRALSSVRPCTMRVHFVQNDGHHVGNARSLWAARDAVRGGFLLAMADHVIEPGIATAVMEGAGPRCRLAVDRAGPDDARADGATLASVAGGAVVELGKHLEDWNAIDTGVLWCSPDIFDAITPELRDGEASAVFAVLARAGRLDAVDVTGMRWADIDTPEDLQRAEAMLAAHGRLA
jgi:choline kinase